MLCSRALSNHSISRLTHPVGCASTVLIHPRRIQTMRRSLLAFLAVVLLSLTLPRISHAQQPQPPTVASAVDRQISTIERQVLDAAEAMPEDKFNFSPETLKSKTDILKFLKDSFALGFFFTATSTTENMLQLPEHSKSPRLYLATF